MILFPGGMRPLLQFLSVTGLAISVVILLVGLFADPTADSQRLRYMVAAAQIRQIVNALNQFRVDCRRYPSPRQGLAVLIIDSGQVGWRGPYLHSLLVDPWGMPYVYNASTSPPRIVSYGADRVPGGQLFAADLFSDAPVSDVPSSPHELHVRRVFLMVWIGVVVLFFGSIGAGVYGFRSASRVALGDDQTPNWRR